MGSAIRTQVAPQAFYFSTDFSRIPGCSATGEFLKCDSRDALVIQGLTRGSNLELKIQIGHWKTFAAREHNLYTVFQCTLLDLGES